MSLIGISPLLSPDLLHALASMGHGDEIVIGDANFPSGKTKAETFKYCELLPVLKMANVSPKRQIHLSLLFSNQT